MNLGNLSPFTFIVGELVSFLFTLGRALIGSLPISISIAAIFLIFKKTRNLKAVVTVVYTAIGYKAAEMIAANHFMNLYEAGHSATNARIMAFFILLSLASLFPTISLLIFKLLNKQSWWKYLIFFIPLLIVHTAKVLQSPH